MARAGAEVAVSEVVQHRLRKGGLEGQREVIVVDVGINPVRIGSRGRPHQRCHVLVHHDVVVIEIGVSGGERCSVRPFGPLDQMHGQGLAVFRPVPRLGKVGHRLQVSRVHFEQRAGAGQTFDQTDVNAAPAIGLASPEVPALRTPTDDMAHHVAVNAGAIRFIRGLVDQRLFRQTLGQGRQFASLFKCLDPIRLVVGGQGLVDIDIRAVDEGRCALSGELRRIRRRGGCHNVSTHRHCGHTQQKRRQSSAPDMHDLSPPVGPVKGPCFSL